MDEGRYTPFTGKRQSYTYIKIPKQNLMWEVDACTDMAGFSIKTITKPETSGKPKETTPQKILLSEVHYCLGCLWVVFNRF